MRVAHICLANFYIDGFGYQENVLTKLHHRMGHDVIIIASTETYLDHTRIGYVEPSRYVNEHGIPVHRLPYARWVPRRFRSKVRAYEGLEDLLKDFAPDLIFVHDVQFWDFLEIKKYARRHRVIVHADCHADYVNSARGFVSRHILHGLFYKAIIQRVDPIVHTYFPTLPARGTFLKEVYGLDPQKMKLLPFGADDTETAGLDRASVRREVRNRLGIAQDANVLVTGGKLDLRKNIHVLIDRFSVAKCAGELGGTHLLVFGQADDEVQKRLDAMEIHEDVRTLGWTAASEIYRIFWAADMAVFPGTHSVLWEEAIGHGLPILNHHWPGMEHLDLGGNLRTISDASPATLDGVLRDLAADDGAAIRRMAEVAAIKGPRVFSFSAIAERALKQH